VGFEGIINLCPLRVLCQKAFPAFLNFSPEVFEEMYYGVLVMVVCDSEVVVYDLWFHPASYHEVEVFEDKV
jgi:hypothetical protein